MENTHYVRCESCGETFQHEYQLENHIRRRHKTQIKCDTCGKIFRSEGALEIHKESHKKPEFKCDRKFCTAEFFTETELLTHTFEHEEKGNLPKSQILSNSHPKFQKRKNKWKKNNWKESQLMSVKNVIENSGQKSLTICICKNTPMRTITEKNVQNVSECL